MFGTAADLDANTPATDPKYDTSAGSKPSSARPSRRAKVPSNAAQRQSVVLGDANYKTEYASTSIAHSKAAHQDRASRDKAWNERKAIAGRMRSSMIVLADASDDTKTRFATSAIGGQKAGGDLSARGRRKGRGRLPTELRTKTFGVQSGHRAQDTTVQLGDNSHKTVYATSSGSAFQGKGSTAATMPRSSITHAQEDHIGQFMHDFDDDAKTAQSMSHANFAPRPVARNSARGKAKTKPAAQRDSIIFGDSSKTEYYSEMRNSFTDKSKQSKQQRIRRPPQKSSVLLTSNDPDTWQTEKNAHFHQ